jgi:hypothetical protein
MNPRRLPLLLCLVPLSFGCPGGEPVPVLPEDSEPPVDTGDSAPDTGPPVEQEVEIGVEWDAADFYTIYDIGPGQELTSPCEVPWGEIQGGTLVRIHHQDEPYRCKWAITTEAYENHPVVIMGVPSEDGELPEISGEGAVTPEGVSWYQEDRWVVRVGGEEQTDVATWVWIQDLRISGARPSNSFSDDQGATTAYAATAAALRIEHASDVHLHGLELSDSNSGLVAAAGSQDVEVVACWIHDNGSAATGTAANASTEVVGVTIEYSRLGPMAVGATGPNLQDRSAGLVLRYSWIDGGDHPIELMGSSDPAITGDPDYQQVFAYGNVFLQDDDGGQLVQYGGEGSALRPGSLHFTHNTVLTQRSDKTVLFVMPSAQQQAWLTNNILHATAGGSLLQLHSGEGAITLADNWLTDGWLASPTGASEHVTDQGNTTGEDPGFADLDTLDLHIATDSPCQGLAGDADAETRDHPIEYQYMKHQRRALREVVEDLGAFEG